MTLTSITLERFAEELGSLHGWSNEAVTEFKSATTHEAMARQDWVRIASTWAIYETELENVPSPLLFVETAGIVLAFEGDLGRVEPRASMAVALQDAETYNKSLRGRKEIKSSTRWYAVKVQIQFADSE